MGQGGGLAQLLQALQQNDSGDGSDGGDDRREKFPSIEAQMLTLKSLYRSYIAGLEVNQGDRPLSPGDFCREREGLGYVREEINKKLVFSVWKLLYYSNAADLEVVRHWALSRATPDSFNYPPDCILAHRDPEENALVFTLHHRAFLERIEESPLVAQLETIPADVLAAQEQSVGENKAN